MGTAVGLHGLRKRFGAAEAVAGVDLEIADGEFFALLGPSGSGKTTVLRLVAGFEAPTEGTVTLAGRDVTRVPPFDRDVNTVFQDYALFPHMTVAENVAYGLMVRKVARAERRRRVAEALEMVRLPEFGGRRPGQLSGGQRQRVALARALVNGPRVLLLDEPLGALDARLRQDMQLELKRIQREVGITFVFVTHDQEEALTMSDRVAVLADGRVRQVGAPAEVYERPASAFVAGFVGTANLLTGAEARRVVGREGTFAIRPEKVTIGDPGAGDSRVEGRVADVVYAGASTRFIVDLDGGGRLVAVRQNAGTTAADVAAMRGGRVALSWRPEHVITFRETHSDPIPTEVSTCDSEVLP